MHTKSSIARSKVEVTARFMYSNVRHPPFYNNRNFPCQYGPERGTAASFSLRLPYSLRAHGQSFAKIPSYGNTGE